MRLGHEKSRSTLALLYSEEGELKTARELLEKDFTEEHHIDALRYLASKYKLKGKTQTAVEILELASNLENETVLCELGQIWAEKKEYDKAELCFVSSAQKGCSLAKENLLELKKYYQLKTQRSLRAHGNLICLCEVLTQQDEAQREFAHLSQDAVERLLKDYTESNTTLSMRNACIIYQLKNEQENAKKFFGYGASKEDSECLFRLAALYVTENKSDKALKILRKLSEKKFKIAPLIMKKILEKEKESSSRKRNFSDTDDTKQKRAKTNT